MKLFRIIRQGLFAERGSDLPSMPNRLSRYFLYAIGEIVLVVVGILIALQINNWNEAKKSTAREMILLAELKVNLESNIENLKKDIRVQTNSVQYFDSIMVLPIARPPFNDSIPRYLQIANFCPDVVLTASAFETLKSTGLGLIHTDSLRTAITNLYEVVYPSLMQETKRLEDQLWPTSVIPLYQKHFMRVDDQWIPNDYQAWLNDQEFFNMMSLRLDLRKGSTRLKKKATEETVMVLRAIERELEKEN